MDAFFRTHKLKKDKLSVVIQSPEDINPPIDIKSIEIKQLKPSN